MRILLLGFSNIRYMPYARFYLDRLDPQRHEIHFLYWDRDGQPEESPAGVTCHRYRKPMEDQISRLRKLPGFWGYRRYALKLLDRQRFDRIVVLHSMPGVLLADRLIRDYRDRFVFDYRDVTYEGFWPYGKVIRSLVEASWRTFISSDGFRRVLPDSPKLCLSHNLRPGLPVVDRPEREGPIRIGFWGFIRHGRTNRQLIAALGGDSRFELHYYGPEQAVARELKSYVNQNAVANVFFHGAYGPGDQDRFAGETDLIHNLYSNTESPSQELAMTNKFYDGLGYGLPQLCARGSYMGELVRREELGLVWEPGEAGLGDRIWAYFRELDPQALRQRCRKVLETVTREYEEGGRLLDDFIPSSP